MRVVMVSKALVVGIYRQKLTEMARLGVDVIAVVPPEWREGGGRQQLEPGEGEYELIVSPVRWNGHFHVHYYPDLPSILRRTHPDLVHLDEEPYNLATYLGLRAARRWGIPGVFFTWQNILRRYPPPFRQIERAVYAGSGAGIAGNADALSVLREKGFRGPGRVIPQFGVDPEVFRPQPVEHSRFRIGFLNRLVPPKAPLPALDAFARLPVDTELVVVGDGPLRGALDAEVRRRGLEARVSIRSRLPSAEMPGLLNTLDAVILPSLTTPAWKEQFGRVLVEAMACGVSVVGSDSGEIPNVIGDAGLIVQEGDAGALASALQSLYESRDLRAQLGERGRQRVLDRFTHRRVAEATVETYREVV